MQPSCSIVIPVYNSEQTLTELTERLDGVLSQLCQHYEIIFVDDGSHDHSWQVIKDLANRYPFVRGFNLLRNFGQHNALLCGVRAAEYDLIVTMDDDLQHPPEEIHKLLEKLNDGLDVVYGKPHSMPHSPWRNLTSKLLKRFLAAIMGIPSQDYIESFRAFRSNLRKAFENYQSPNVALDVLLGWGTRRFGVVEVEEKARIVGRSNYTLGKLFSLALFYLTGFSVIPLRLASFLGFLFTFLGLVVFIYVVVIYFSEGSIPGFPFLASLIALFSGVQLFTLGIFGEYLAHIFERSLDRPTYVIAETTEQ